MEESIIAKTSLRCQATGGRVVMFPLENWLGILSALFLTFSSVALSLILFSFYFILGRLWQVQPRTSLDRVLSKY